MKDDNIRRNMLFVSAVAEAVVAQPASTLDALIEKAKVLCASKEKQSQNAEPHIVTEANDQD
jgi:hypothetical protein